MKKNNLKKVISCMLTVMVAATTFCSTRVMAGSSDIVIDDSSFAESLNSSVWNAPNSDITVSDGKIVFSSENTQDTRLITRNAVVKSSQHDELFSAEFTIKLQEIPQNAKFAVAFSLANMESYLNEEESIALVFTNDGGALKAGVFTYDADGNEVSLAGLQKVGGTFGKNLSVRATAGNDMQFAIEVDGRTLFKGEAPIDLTGRIGFLQDDTCLAEISHVSIVSHKYDTPENANVLEDFEKETINVNAFDSYMNGSNNYFPSGLRIEEYNGENVLMFRNVGMGWFGTMYKYSNFECTFDVPYILFNNVLRENGTVQQPASSGFIFSYGDVADYYDALAYDTSADAIIFENNEIRNIRDYSKRTLINNLDLYDRDNNVGYSVKIRVEDTQFTLYVKSLGESEWQQILSYKIGNETPTGYIHIWSASSANFAIDNFEVKNLDKGAKTIEVAYEGSAIEGAEDWEYKPMKDVYLESTDEKEPSYWWLPVVGVACGAVVVMGSIFITKKGSKKEAENNV